MSAKTWLVGILILIVTATVISISLPQSVKISVTGSSTTFYTWNNGAWNIGGIETSKLYNGTKSLTATRTLSYNTNTANFTNITRTSDYGSATLVDNYQFDGSITDKSMIPVAETHEIIGGKGLIYQYQVSNLPNGFIEDLTGKNSIILGNMKVTWDSGYYYAKITNSSKGLGTLTLKYKVKSNDFLVNIRLFDPMDISHGSGNISLTGCGVLNKAGAYYIVNADLKSDEACIDVEADGITIDGNNHTIRADTLFAIGVVNRKNVIVKNFLYDDSNNIRGAVGVLVDGSLATTIENMTMPLYADGSEGIKIVKSTGTILIGDDVTQYGKNQIAVYDDNIAASVYTENNIR